MSKLFSYYGVVKFRRNLNSEKMDTGIFKEYLKQNIIMAVLRKVNAHAVVICRLIEKSII